MKKKVVVGILISIIMIMQVFPQVNSAQINYTNQIKNSVSNIAVENKVSDKTEKTEESKETKKVEEKKESKNEIENRETANSQEKTVENKVSSVKEGSAAVSEEKTQETSKKEEIKKEQNKEYISQDDLIYSTKYLIKGKVIYKIEPKTSIEEFKKNIEIAEGQEIKIYKGEKEIKSGYIGTGMKIKGKEEGEEYTACVRGDITGDGISNQIELTKIIRHIIGLKGWKLEGIEKEAGDITGDGETNLVDVSKLINYIVYGKWEYEKVSVPQEPKIEVISKKEEGKEYYIDKVEIKIEGKSVEGKITYRITGSKEEKETEIKAGEIVTIEGEGEYLVTAYSYGKEGNKSKGNNIKIVIKNTIPALTKENTSITQEPKDWTNKEVKVKISTELKGYIVQYSKDGSTWKDYKEAVEVEENGKLYARLRNEEERIGKKLEIEIGNIDKLKPEKVEIERATQDTNSIELEAVAEDAEATEKDGKSGIAKYYFSKDGGSTWEPEEGKEEGTYRFENLKHKETYKIVVKAEDKAGNSKETEIKEVTTGEIPEGKGNIKITKSEKNWTNRNIKIELENKAGEEYKIEYSKDGSTWEEYTEELEIEYKGNGKLYARLKDKAGNTGTPVEEEITNIDKVLPVVEISPNGGNYVMPSTGNAKIVARLTAEDPEETEENGQSGLIRLSYAWSKSNEEEPKIWTDFINESKVEKTDIDEAGTWYLWTKVEDIAGNRAESIKVSDPFVVGSNEELVNKITLTPDKTEWTNEDVIVEVAFGRNLVQNKKITCTGTEGEDYIINEEEGTLTVKTNGMVITAEAEDIEGNKVVTSMEILNIDKENPTVEISPNGGNYVMPSIGNAKISTILTAEDPEVVEGNGQSGLDTLSYAWSKSSEAEPEEWTDFTNGNEIEKTDIEEVGTWYLWTKVEDKVGNRAEVVKVSDPFVVGSNEELVNKITLTPDKTEWTNEDVEVAVNFGANLVENRKITCTGTEDEDYIINEEAGTVTVKTNGKTVNVEAEDVAGNKVVASMNILNIDKIRPEVILEPNGKTDCVMPSEGNAKISTILTAEDPEETEESGQSGLIKLSYSWSKSKEEEPEEWVEFTNESKVEKTDIEEPGTWYLWTKVEDVAGNRAEDIKVSNPFVIGSNEDEINKITLTPDKTEWTNENVIVEVVFGGNLVQNKKIACTGTEGENYIINEEEGTVTVKTNGIVITAEAEDVEGNKVVTSMEISNIDKENPTVEISPNGGMYTMPSQGKAKIDAVLTAEDLVETEEDTLATLQYAWSKSNTEEPTEWTDFINGSKVEKTEIEELGTWYLWTKVLDKAGNRAEDIKVSNPFVVESNEELANKIILTPDKTEWTNKDVNVVVTFGSNLTQNRGVNCTGTEGKDYEVTEDGNVSVKTNGKIVVAMAEDASGNKVVTALTIGNIDKKMPVVEVSPNGGNYVIPTEGEAKITTILTAKDPEIEEGNGQSGLATLEYAWSKSNEIEPEEWTNFTSGSKIEKIDLQEVGTWYLWTKVTDVAGNRAESIKVSDPFVVGSSESVTNKITLTPDKTEWTNEDVTVEVIFGENLVQNKKITCTGVNGVDYEITEEEGNVIVKTNNKVITAEAEDIAGNKIVASINILNIDKIKPEVNLEPNGRTDYAMPSEGNAKISTILTAEDPEAVEGNGQSGLGTLSYAWSKSNTIEPTEWTDFTNGSKVEKIDLQESGTWYLWTKVIDVAGNRAESIKVSNPFVVGSNEELVNKITLTPNKTEWTNEDVEVTVSFGANLSKNRKITCTGTEGEDYIINEEEGTVIVKTNGKVVNAEAEDVAGNKAVISLNIANIDKSSPIVGIGPNGGMYTMPYMGEAKIVASLTAEDPEETEKNGQSGLNALEYAWSKSKDEEPEEWTSFTSGSKIEKTDIAMPGTWYLWTKVEDVAGNRAESIKVSNPFIIGSNKEEANKITLTPNKTEWTNEDVEVAVSFGANLVQNKKITCTGTVGKDYIINEEEGTVIVKTNGKVINVEAEDVAGNKVIANLSVENIDKIKPEVSLAPNGKAGYVMPSTGNGKISTTITAKDLEETEENGQSGLSTLEYAWSESNTIEPEAWIDFTNGNRVEKTDIAMPGTWYLWTKVTDVAGNRAESIKVSNAFIIETNATEANSISLIPDKTEWTNEDVTVEIIFGENLTENRRITCTGTEGEDYIINEETGAVIVKTNGKAVTAMAEDMEGNQIVTTLNILNIDKIEPTVEMTPNKGTYTMPSIGNAKLNTTVTAQDLGGSDLGMLEYSWTLSDTTIPSEGWKEFTNGGKAEITGITEPGEWYLWVKVRDNAGNWAKTVKTKEFTLTNNTDPENQITLTQDKTEWTNEDVKIKIEKGANLTGENIITSNGVEGIDYEVDSQKSIVTVKANNVTITVTSADGAGNEIVKSIQITNIDKQNPIITATPESADYAKSKDITITVEEPGDSGLNSSNSYEYYLSTSDVALSGGEWTSYASGVAFRVGEGKTGTYYLFVRRISDEAGNESTENGIVTTIGEASYQKFGPYKFDNTLPTINELSGSAVWTNQNVTLTGKGTDSQSGIVAYQFSKLDNLTSESSGWTSITATTSQIQQTKVVDKNETWYFYLKDRVGNINKKEIEAKIDKEAPKITSVLASPSQTSASINLSLGITDNASGISEIEWYYKLSTTSTYSKLTDTFVPKNGANAGQKELEIESKEISRLRAGTYNIYAIVYDVAGNSTRSPSTGSINIKTAEMPIAEGNVTFNYTPSTWTSGSVNVGITKKEAVDGYTLEYSTDNKTWNSYTAEIPMSANGKVYARLKDSMGNIGAVATGNVTNIDTVEPTINRAINSPSQTSSSIDLSLTVTDSMSGLSTIEWYYKHASDTEYTKLTDTYTEMHGADTGATTSVTKTKHITGLTIGETYNAYAIVYDVTGNQVRSPKTGQLGVTIQANWNNETTSKKYMTMQDAFAEASSGDTLTLLRDYTDRSSPNLTKEVIVDTKNYKIEKMANGITIASNGTLKLKGTGTITTGDNIDLIINRGNLYLAYSALTASGNIGYYNFTGTLVNRNYNSSSAKAVIWNQSSGKLSTNSPLSTGCTIRGAYRSIYNSGTVNLNFVNFTYYTNPDNNTYNYGCTLYNDGDCTLNYCTVNSWNNRAIENSGTLTISGNSAVSAGFGERN